VLLTHSGGALLRGTGADQPPLPDGRAGGGWHYAGGPWNTSAAGALTAPGKVLPCGGKTAANCTHPTGGSDANVAFYVGKQYEDFEASFDFDIQTPFSAAGLIFQARR
jgi:hypothetical protein